MTKLQANLLLLLAAAMWGGGNVAQKTILEDIDPLSAAGLRSLIGGLLVVPLLLLVKEQAIAGKGWKASLFRVSALFALALIVQQIAYLDSSVTNASFLVNTDVVITPLFAWLLTRARPSLCTYLAVALTFTGLFLMSGGALAGLGRGDLTALLSAALYALWIVELERHMRCFGRPIATSAAQFFGAAILALPVGIWRGGVSADGLYGAAPELVVLGAFSTALAFGLMTAAQRFTSATHSAIIVGSECIFGALAAYLLLGERPPITAVAGGGLIAAAIVVVALSGQRPEPAVVPARG